MDVGAGGGVDVVLDGLMQVRGGEQVMMLWCVGVGKSMLMLRLMQMLVLMWVVACVRQHYKACQGTTIWITDQFQDQLRDQLRDQL